MRRARGAHDDRSTRDNILRLRGALNKLACECATCRTTDSKRPCLGCAWQNELKHLTLGIELANLSHSAHREIGGSCWNVRRPCRSINRCTVRWRRVAITIRRGVARTADENTHSKKRDKKKGTG